MRRVRLHLRLGRRACRGGGADVVRCADLPAAAAAEGHPLGRDGHQGRLQPQGLCSVPHRTPALRPAPQASHASRRLGVATARRPRHKAARALASGLRCTLSKGTSPPLSSGQQGHCMGTVFVHCMDPRSPPPKTTPAVRASCPTPAYPRWTSRRTTRSSRRDWPKSHLAARQAFARSSLICACPRRCKSRASLLPPPSTSGRRGTWTNSEARVYGIEVDLRIHDFPVYVYSVKPMAQATVPRHTTEMSPPGRLGFHTSTTTTNNKQHLEI